MAIGDKIKKLPPPYYCSFCGRDDSKVGHLIVGKIFCDCKEGGASLTAICDECVSLSVEAFSEKDVGFFKSLCAMMLKNPLITDQDETLKTIVGNSHVSGCVCT